MRSCFLRCAFALAVALGSLASPIEPPAATAEPLPQAKEKSPKDKASKEKLVKLSGWPAPAGIKTPGIQIPFVSLKEEAAIPTGVSSPVVSFGPFALIGGAGKDGLQRVDLKTNKILDTIAGLKTPCGVSATAFESLWVLDCGDRNLVRIDPKERKVKSAIALTAAPSRQVLAASSDSIWVLADAKTSLVRIDPEENRIVSEVRLPAGCSSILFGEQALWVACPASNFVLRIDAQTSLVSTKIETSGEPVALLAAENSIWALTRKDGKLLRIDPKTNKITSTIELKIPQLDGTLAFGDGNIWVSGSGYPITRIDPTPEKEKVMQQFAGEGGGSLYFAASSLWMADAKSGSLLRYDPKRIRATLAE